jgi:hypothetical protein
VSIGVTQKMEDSIKQHQEQKAEQCKPEEKVQHPLHYGGDTPYEVIKVLRNWFSEDQFEGFLVGNAIKYLARYRKKNGVEDVQKAEFYVKYLEKFLLEK